MLISHFDQYRRHHFCTGSQSNVTDLIRIGSSFKGNKTRYSCTVFGVRVYFLGSFLYFVLVVVSLKLYTVFFFFHLFVRLVVFRLNSYYINKNSHNFFSMFVLKKNIRHFFFIRFAFVVVFEHSIFVISIFNVNY